MPFQHGAHLLTALASTRRSSPRQDVTLWWLDLDDPVCQACAAVLSDDERERVGRMVFDRDRRRMAAARGVLRVLLGEWVGESPERLLLSRRGAGKPWMPDHPGRFFNLSHSQHSALIAVTCAGEVGVDLEVLRGESHMLELAGRVLTANEQVELMSDKDAAARSRRFFQGWTRKEACLKAVGWGLALDPQDFEVGTGTDSRRVRLTHAGQYAELELTSLSLDTEVAAAMAIAC